MPASALRLRTSAQRTAAEQLIAQVVVDGKMGEERMLRVDGNYVVKKSIRDGLRQHSGKAADEGGGRQRMGSDTKAWLTGWSCCGSRDGGRGRVGGCARLDGLSALLLSVREAFNYTTV